MKKQGRRSNIVHLNNRKKKKSSRTIAKQLRTIELRKAVRDFFHAYDSNPPLGWVRSSEVLCEFKWHSLIDCSAKSFGQEARKYVHAEKKGGLMHYKLKNQVILHLLSIRDDAEQVQDNVMKSGEVYKEAA